MTQTMGDAAGPVSRTGATGVVGHDLLRTGGGLRLHIAPCPHLLRHTTRVATAAERLSIPLCHWCAKEVAGHGRTYVDSLEAAMRLFGSHVETLRLIREHLSGVQWDQIWIPNSRSYIALGRSGRGVAWVGKGYVVPTRGAFVSLPGFLGHGRGGAAGGEKTWGEQCGRCFMQRSVSGVCDCD